jgi:hypothetical protein
VVSSEDFHEASDYLLNIRKWQYLNNQSYALAKDYFTNSDGRNTGSALLCIFDANCQLIDTLFSEKTNPETRSQNNVLPSGRVYIVPNAQRYVSQSINGYGRYDLKDEHTNAYCHMVPKYIKDRRIEQISTMSFQEGKISFLYTENLDFGCVQYDLNKDFESISHPKFIALEKKDYYQGIMLALTENSFCVFENTHQSVIWYDKETGLIKDRYYFQEINEEELPGRFPITISEITGSLDTLYMLDYWNQCVYTCTNEGFQKTINLKQFFPYGECKNLVADGDTIYLLHTGSSCIAVFKDGFFSKWIHPFQIGAEVIHSFDVSGNEILVNDTRQGKVFVNQIPYMITLPCTSQSSVSFEVSMGLFKSIAIMP